MRKKLSTEVKNEKDFKKIYHPSHNFLVNYMETFAQDTYWLFGSEACSICRSHQQSNIDGKIDHVGVDEIANQIIHDSNIFAIHMSKPRSIDYPMDLLDAYNGWEDYEKIDKDLYDILKIFQIKNRDYSHRKEYKSKLNK